ncbi:hypothetical protein HMPREF1487_06595 [Pseudomonas sp. HPB0071]|nr:hypothetical protein HMPREF1487_06595 [Pseudomonas sp. HPB0071]
MSDILLFKPKAELDARTNLEAFIAMCRDKLTVFGVIGTGKAMLGQKYAILLSWERPRVGTHKNSC